MIFDGRRLLVRQNVSLVNLGIFTDLLVVPVYTFKFTFYIAESLNGIALHVSLITLYLCQLYFFHFGNRHASRTAIGGHPACHFQAIIDVYVYYCIVLLEIFSYLSFEIIS